MSSLSDPTLAAAAARVLETGVGLAEPDVVHILHWMFDRQLHVGETGADGRIAVTIGCQSVERCAAEIAGLGARVEVTAPPQARAHLAQLARDLSEIYAER